MKIITDIYLRCNKRLYIDYCTDIHEITFKSSPKIFLFNYYCKKTRIYREFYFNRKCKIFAKVRSISGSISYFAVIV